jgi:hypothetical protein
MASVNGRRVRASLGSDALILGCACVAAVAAFAFRFLTFRGLPNDQYMHLMWARQVLEGAVPGRDFWEPGMPLAIALSAMVQACWPGPFSEGLLSIAGLAVAAGVTCCVVAQATRAVSAGVAAAALQIALLPRLYSYPKVLVPAVALLLLHRYVQRPAAVRLGTLAAWAVAAFLFRHDLGVIAAVAIAAGLLVMDDSWGARTQHVVRFVTFGLLLVSPYVLFVAWNEGLAEHVRVGIEFSKAEAHQFLLFRNLPPLSPAALASTTLAKDDAGGLLFWLTHAALAALAIVLIVDRRNVRLVPLYAATLVLLVAYRVEILRHPIAERVPDLSGVLALTLGWCTGTLLTVGRASEAMRVSPLGAGAAAAFLAPFLLGAWSLAPVAGEIDEANVLRGLGAMRQQAAGVYRTGTASDWDRYWPAGEAPPITRYLRECTAPEDRMLITWPAPEFYYFARRPFAAGHALLLPGVFSSAADQQTMLARLERERVPIVLVNESRADEFERSFPQLDAWIRDRYVVHSRFTIRDGSTVALAVRRELTALRSYGGEDWPCGFEADRFGHMRGR